MPCIQDNPFCVPGGDPDRGVFRVISEFPRNGSVSSPLCTVIFAGFSRPVDNATVSGNFNVKECLDPPNCRSPLNPLIIGTADSLDKSGNPTQFVEFVPAADLKINTTYLVEVISSSVFPKSLKSTSGDFLSGNYTWIFKTG